MDAQEVQKILDDVPANTTIRDWYDIVPLGHPDYWRLPPLLRTFASLSLHWSWTKAGWLKLHPDLVYYERLFIY